MPSGSSIVYPCTLLPFKRSLRNICLKSVHFTKSWVSVWFFLSSFHSLASFYLLFSTSLLSHLNFSTFGVLSLYFHITHILPQPRFTPPAPSMSWEGNSSVWARDGAMGGSASKTTQERMQEFPGPVPPKQAREGRYQRQPSLDKGQCREKFFL